jgi:hypothetical protein
MHSDAIHSRHRRTELDGNRPNPDYTTSIYFGRCWTTTVKYLWLSRVDGRGRAPGYFFELVYSKRFQVGQSPGCYHFFLEINRLIDRRLYSDSLFARNEGRPDSGPPRRLKLQGRSIGRCHCSSWNIGTVSTTDDENYLDGPKGDTTKLGLKTQSLDPRQ